MGKRKGYPCEICHQSIAKYEARDTVEYKNLLLCKTCLKKSKYVHDKPNTQKT